MKKLLFATSLLTAIACSGAAFAQATNAPVGKAAGTFMIRARAIGVLPETTSSSIYGAVNGGHVAVSNSAAPEVDFSYFLTDNIAFELIAATTEHDLYAKGTPGLPASYKVGSTWVLPPTLVAQYHFFPKEKFSPYVGVGLNVTFFYNSKGAGVVNSVAMTNAVGPAIQAGFDYNFSGHWFANVDVKQIFFTTTASLNGGAIKAKTALDPTVVGAGIGYRF